MHDSDEIVGDETARAATWNGSTYVRDLAGKKLKIRIYLKDADLFSLRFAK